MNLKTVFWYYRGGGLDTFHCLYFKISPNHCLIDCLDSLLQWKAFQKVWCKGRGGEGVAVGAPGKFSTPEPT